MEIKKYDLICSLGGNCMIASQLRQRGMRPFSLPFDWCYFTTTQAIKYLCEGFKDDFKNFLLKENLVPLEGEEYNTNHTDKAQFKDTYTGYYFANHFPLNVPLSKSYCRVNKKIQKRIKRLIKAIKKSKKILFMISTVIEIDISEIENLKQALQEKYPSKVFDFRIISFGRNKDEIIEKENILIKNYERKDNFYDFVRTNIEWQYMVDNIVLNPQKTFAKILRTKKGYGIQLLPFINTLFRIKLYFLGLRFEICLGKQRD